MKHFAAFAFALVLAGCASGTGPSQTQVGQGAVSLCTAAGNSLKVLAAARSQGKLSASQVQTVLTAEKLTDPVCTAPTPPTDAVSAAANLATGLASLATVQTQVK